MEHERLGSGHAVHDSEGWRGADLHRVRVLLQGLEENCLQQRDADADEEQLGFDWGVGLQLVDVAQ